MRWLATLAVVAWIQAATPSAQAGEHWPGEWSPGRPNLALVDAMAPPRTSRRIERDVFRLDVPFRTQKDGGPWQVSNCGPATLGMVLDAFGPAGQATDDLRYRAHWYQGTIGSRTGIALEHIAQVAGDLGVPTIGPYAEGGRFHAWSLDEIREQLRLGRPVMPLIRLYLLPGKENVGPRWGHYILLTGLADDGFYYNDSLQTDPAIGTTGWVPAAQLERAMYSSHFPGQALAFGGPEMPPLRVWTP